MSRPPLVVMSVVGMVVKPSRLKLTNLTPGSLETKVSVEGLKPGWARKSWAPVSNAPLALMSEKTNQPVFQFAPVVRQLGVEVLALLEGHTVTVDPSLTASERAYCKSPRSRLTSADTRLEFVTYL